MRWKDNRIKEEMEEEIVCKLWTQEPENFDEEVKSLGTAWRPLTFIPFILCFFQQFFIFRIIKERSKKGIQIRIKKILMMAAAGL